MVLCISDVRMGVHLIWSAHVGRGGGCLLAVAQERWSAGVCGGGESVTKPTQNWLNCRFFCKIRLIGDRRLRRCDEGRWTSVVGAPIARFGRACRRQSSRP